MVKTAHEGSGGNCAPRTTIKEEFAPGQVLCRVVAAPKGLLSGLSPAPTAFMCEAKAHVWTENGFQVIYLLACGDTRFWTSGANYKLVDPPAPSGFVAVPPAPEAPTPTVTAASVEPTPRPELSDIQRRMLVEIYSAGAVGLAYSLECKHAKLYGAARAGAIIAQLQGLGLARPVRETDDSQGGWCLTPAGEEFAEPLWREDHKSRKAAQAPQPPEAGDVLAEPGQIAWQAHGIGGLRSADGRFEVRHRGSLFDAVDTWTHETSGTFSVARSAQDWCWRRLATDPLEWRTEGTDAKVEVASVEPQGFTFSVVPCMGTNLVGQFLGIDQRFGFGHRNRHSPYFPSAELAKRWCEVRAACVATMPELALRYVSPVPF